MLRRARVGHEFSMRVRSVRDPVRKRTLRIELYYPKGPGIFPVILFSPGTKVAPSCYSYLGRAWARAGYFCIFICHRGVSERIDHFKFLEMRAEDISTVRQSLTRIAKSLKDFQGQLGLVGLAGH